MKKTVLAKPTKEIIQKAKELILSGEVVAMPTETVYGLSANAFDDEAIKKIFIAKGRPQDNPLIVHISNMEQLEKIAYVTPLAKKLAENLWPGPLTMVLKKKDCISEVVSGGLDTVGVRMPNHPVALELIETCGVPLPAPSANISGKPSPTKATHVLDDFDGKIDLIIDGGECEVGVESTVISIQQENIESEQLSVHEERITILRPGAITANDLLEYCDRVYVGNGVLNKLDENVKVQSPGMKYKHYAPNAQVIMLDGNFKEFCDYVYKNADENTGVLVFENEESMFEDIEYVYTYGREDDSLSQANKLFDVLRQIDKNEKVSRVFARMPKKQGVGLAVYNRLLRACGFKIEKLKNPYIVGLTGQTGSGKSTVCKALTDRGIAIIDCDKISREVINKAEVLEKLVDYFGTGIMYADGTLNRRELAILAFSDEENLIFLNSVMYPQITKVVKEQISKLKEKGENIIILDAPTLFESKANVLCDKTIAVIADKEVRLERIVKRDNITKQEGKIRMKAQHTNDFYTDRCGLVIENDGDLQSLEQKAVRVIDSIKQEIQEKSQI